jgi:hypothetical protein
LDYFLARTRPSRLGDGSRFGVRAEIQLYGRSVERLGQSSSLTFKTSGVLLDDGAEAGLNMRRQIGAHVDAVDVEGLGVDGLVRVSVKPSTEGFLPKVANQRGSLVELLLIEDNTEI